MAAYLTWPDARLRAYLRERGISEEHIPGDRPSLLQETRIRWVQTQNSSEALFSKIKEIVNSGVYRAEDALHRLLSLLIGGWEESKGRAETEYENIKDTGNSAYEDAELKWEETKKAGDAYETSAELADDTLDKGREKLGEKMKVGGDKVKGEL